MRFLRLQLKHLTWHEFVRRLAREVEEDTVADISAQLSYYFLFSLFPALFFLVTLLAYLPVSRDSVQYVVERAATVMPGDAVSLVRAHLEDLLLQPRPRLLTAGFAVTLWSASRGVDAMRKALNLAYDVPESRPWWRTQVLAMVMTVAGLLLIPLAFSMFLLGGKAGEWLATKLALVDAFHWAWAWLRWPFTAAVVMLALALSYYLLPDVKQRFKYITPGSVLGTLAWLGATWAFTQYVEHFGKYNVTYGSIGSVVVLMLWLYITGFIFIMGGEVNAVLEHASGEGKAKGARREGEAPPLEPAVRSPGDAKSAATAHRSRLKLFRWRRRVAAGQMPEPSEKDAPRGPLP